MLSVDEVNLVSRSKASSNDEAFLFYMVLGIENLR